MRRLRLLRRARGLGGPLRLSLLALLLRPLRVEARLPAGLLRVSLGASPLAACFDPLVASLLRRRVGDRVEVLVRQRGLVRLVVGLLVFVVVRVFGIAPAGVERLEVSHRHRRRIQRFDQPIGRRVELGVELSWGRWYRGLRRLRASAYPSRPRSRRGDSSCSLASAHSSRRRHLAATLPRESTYKKQ